MFFFSLFVDRSLSFSLFLTAEITEEEFIIKKYDKWRERLSVKPTLSEIDALILEGRRLGVDCSQDIKKLEFEKEEAEIWC